MEETKHPMDTEDTTTPSMTEPPEDEAAATAPPKTDPETEYAAKAPLPKGSLPDEDAAEAVPPQNEDAAEAAPLTAEDIPQDAPSTEPPPSPKRFRIPAYCLDFLKALVSLTAVLLLLYGLHSAWHEYRLTSFRAQVQEALREPDGIDKLPRISDWRVREIGVQTFQVSRSDGAYVVYVWRLSDGAYMVDTIRRMP